MFDVSGKAFFMALRAAIERHLGADHPSHVVVERACKGEEATAADTRAVQDALGALAPDVAARLMADVHKAMRESPDGILAMWHGSGTLH